MIIFVSLLEKKKHDTCVKICMRRVFNFCMQFVIYHFLVRYILYRYIENWQLVGIHSTDKITTGQ